MRIKSFWSAGEWRGIPVRFHWTVLLALPWLWYHFHSLRNAAIALPCYIFLLVAHECGHAVVARRHNIPVDGIDVFMVHGQCRYETPYYEQEDVLISWGGVAVQAAILAMALLAQFFFHSVPFSVWFFLEPIWDVFITINFYTIILNLLPIAPLDGEKAWRVLTWIRDWLTEKLPRPKAKTHRPSIKELNYLEAESEKLTAEIIGRLRNK